MSMMETTPLTLTESAARRIAELVAQEAKPDMMLRLAVSGGGCSGFQYGFTLDDSVNPDDKVIEKSGAKASLVNSASADAAEAVAAAAAGKAPPATIKKNDVTGDAIKCVSALVAGHKAANDILEGALQVFV